MVDWLCPNCKGGFPTPTGKKDEPRGRLDRCPWCGHGMDGWEVELR